MANIWASLNMAAEIESFKPVLSRAHCTTYQQDQPIPTSPTGRYTVAQMQSIANDPEISRYTAGSVIASEITASSP